MKTPLFAVLSLAVASIALAEDPKTPPDAAPAAAKPAENQPATAAAPAPDTGAGTVRYAADKVTLDTKAYPSDALVAEIARQAGATVTGTVESPRPITAKWTDLPVKDALQDVLGTQNFTLTYSDKGELRTIALRGSQQEGMPAVPSPDDTAITDKNRAPASETAVFKSFDILGKIPVEGAIAKRLGKDTAPWDVVTNHAYGDPDPKVRRSAVEAGMKAFEADEALRDRVMSATNGMTDVQLAAFARSHMYHRAEDFVRNVRRSTTNADVRRRATDVLRELGTMPFEGPIPLEMATPEDAR